MKFKFNVAFYSKAWSVSMNELFDLDSAVIIAEQNNKPLILCTDEPSMIVAQSYDIPAFAITFNEKGEIPEDLLQSLKEAWSGDIWIIPDRDEPAGAMEFFSKKLSSEGYNVYILKLRGGEVDNLGDFCAVHKEDTEKALNELFLSLTSPADKRFALRSLEEFATRPLKEWIIDQIIGKKDLVMIWGASSTGKTFVILDMMATLARGNGLFAGRFKVNSPANVIFMTAEGLGGLSQRVKALMKASGLTPEQKGRIRIIEEVVNLATPTAANHYKVFLQELQKQGFQPDVIFIDHLSSTIPGFGDIDQKAATLVSEAISEIHRVTGSAVVLIHHAGYDDTHHRGASNYKDILDTQIQTRSEKNPRKMKCTKNKDGEYWEDVTYHIVPVAGTESCVVEWVGAPPPKDGTALEYVVKYLTEHGPSTIAQVSVSTTRIPIGTIRIAIQRAEEDKVLKVVRKEGKANVYDIQNGS
jgi:hypothetical protein